MICRKCIYLVRESKNFDEIQCQKFKGLIHIPCICAKFVDKKTLNEDQKKKENK